MEAVRTLTPDLVASAAKLLADAFFTNPAHIYICPDSDTRSSRLEWLLGANLRLQLDLRESFCLADGSVVHAMGFWTRSTAPGPGVLRKIRSGLLGAPFHLGWPTLRRALEVAHAIDLQVEQTLGERPFWYLNNMAVRDRRRGSGTGTHLLRKQLELVSEREPTYAVVLSTQRPENVSFHQRSGFRVARDQTIGKEPGAFRNWTMLMS